MEKLLAKSPDAAYSKFNGVDDNGNPIEQVYSAYQRNEMAEQWLIDGKIVIKVRPLTREESTKRRERAAKRRQKAIDDGDLIIDRVGRGRWKKH